MSHKCLRCGTIYDSFDSSLDRGCTCGSTFFLLMKSQQDVQQIDEMKKELETKDTTLEKEIVKKIEEEKKVEEEIELKEPTKRKPVKRFRKIDFGIETVRMPKEGVYEINLDALMQKRPLIVLEKGKIYLISLPTIFEKVKKRF